MARNPTRTRISRREPMTRTDRQRDRFRLAGSAAEPAVEASPAAIPRRYLSPNAGESHGYLSDPAMKQECRVRRSGGNRKAPDPARCGDRGKIVSPASGGSRSRRDRERKADAGGE